MKKDKWVLQLGIGLATLVAGVASVFILLAGSGEHGKNSKPFETSMVGEIFEKQLGSGWVEVFSFVFILASYSSMVTVSRGAAVVVLDIWTEPSKKTAAVPDADQQSTDSADGQEPRSISPTDSGESGTMVEASSTSGQEEGTNTEGSTITTTSEALNQDAAEDSSQEMTRNTNQPEANSQEENSEATRHTEAGPDVASDSGSRLSLLVQRSWQGCKERWQRGGLKETDARTVGFLVEVVILLSGALPIVYHGQ